MRKLFLSIVLIFAPLLAYAGKLLGWWSLMISFDILAHSSVSIGLAISVAVILKKVDIIPMYLNIIIPVVFIGASWELGQLILNQSWYISNLEMMKDITIDSVGALIGATIMYKRG